MIYTKEINHTTTEITLATHKLWSIEGDQRVVLSCTKGSLWITQEADLNDYILNAGKDFRVTKPGRIVVEALIDAQFKYSLNKLDNHVRALSNLRAFKVSRIEQRRSALDRR